MLQGYIEKGRTQRMNKKRIHPSWVPSLVGISPKRSLGSSHLFNPPSSVQKQQKKTHGGMNNNISSIPTLKTPSPSPKQPRKESKQPTHQVLCQQQTQPTKQTASSDIRHSNAHFQNHHLQITTFHNQTTPPQSKSFSTKTTTTPQITPKTTCFHQQDHPF